MSEIRIHVWHAGKVCVAPKLPFGGDNCTMKEAAGIGVRKKDRIWLPVSAYLVEHPEHGRILVDTGWNRNMSPEGKYDKKAMIASFGNPLLYLVNQGVVEKGQTVKEQLAAMGLAPKDLDYILLSHLDVDHVSGLSQLSEAKHIIVSNDEISCAYRKDFNTRVRYQKHLWEGTGMKGVNWNGQEGPFGRSYDVFNDGSIVMINIPGHSNGLCAVKVTSAQGKFVLLFSDGGYGHQSWEQMITSGITVDKEKQKKSLEWIRKMSMDPYCVESLANHDADVKPHVITL